MDTTDYPSLGRLALFTAQLRTHSEQVATVVDAQLDDIERLFRAASDRDWDAVLRLSEVLVSQCPDPADKAVVRSARKVRDALFRDPSGSRVDGRLRVLLDTCREAKRRRETRY
jgi:hypothetical protein